MWGIEFRKANNCLFSVEAEFIVRGTGLGPDRDKLYKLYHGPYSFLEMMNKDGGWKTVITSDDPIADGEVAQGFGHRVEKFLPQNYGLEWTWEYFLLALTFWEEGQEAGYHKGAYESRERAANLDHPQQESAIHKKEDCY